MKGKRIVFESKGQATLVEVAVPTPRPDDIVIENDYTVISAGTERANLLQLPNTDRDGGKGISVFPGLQRDRACLRSRRSGGHL
jgi:hypothetical protein